MKKQIFLLSLIISLYSTPLLAQVVYMSPSQALKTIFHSSKDIIVEKKTLSAAQLQSLKKTLGYEVSRKDWSLYIAKTLNKIDGYAFIDNEIGKTEPITFLTALTPKGEVRDVEILVYRESHGSEVHQKPFLKQFEQKKLNDPIRVGQDIKNISGATLSSRAVSKGVKRALALWNLFYASK